MLSQLTKTIKLALKSTQEERAILRARSAVQRFPVVEWRQRLEDFQRRSIATSRANAGDNAWGYDLGDVGIGGAAFYAHDVGSTTSLAQRGRNGSPNSSAPPSPIIDQRTLAGSPAPSGDNANGYFENNNQLSAGPGFHNRFSKDKRQVNRGSGESFYDEDPNASPLYYEEPQNGGRGKPKFFPGGYDDEDVPSSQASSDQGDGTVVGSNNSRLAKPPASYDNFLAAANRQFAKTSGGKNAPDPYFDAARQNSDAAGNFAPARPFSEHSRMSSFDSISSIMDEKTASPLNKAMETVSVTRGLSNVLTFDSLPTRTARSRRISCRS